MCFVDLVHCCLPHASGGVSKRRHIAPDHAEFSPRAWGCVWTDTAVEPDGWNRPIGASRRCGGIRAGARARRRQGTRWNAWREDFRVRRCGCRSVRSSRSDERSGPIPFAPFAPGHGAGSTDSFGHVVRIDSRRATVCTSGNNVFASRNNRAECGAVGTGGRPGRAAGQCSVVGDASCCGSGRVRQVSGCGSGQVRQGTRWQSARTLRPPRCGVRLVDRTAQRRRLRSGRARLLRRRIP